MTIKARIFPLLALGMLAAGCASIDDKEFLGYKDPGFGEANRATFAAMVINPDPQYDTPIPATSAEHAAQAIESYRTEKVKVTERIQTTETSSDNLAQRDGRPRHGSRIKGSGALQADQLPRHKPMT